MLVEKKPKNQILSMKLVTGEEIIALHVYSGNGNYRVKRPLIMVMTEDPSTPNKAQVVFAPWMLGISADTEVTIRNEHILFMSDAAGDAAREYERATNLDSQG